MAVIRPIEADRGIDVGGIPNTRVSDAVGQGIRQLGAGIATASRAEQEMELRRERRKLEMMEFRQDQRLRRFNDDFSLDFAKTQQNIDPSGEGFTEEVSRRFNERAEQFLSEVPEELRPRFEELVANQRNAFINKAAANEIDQRHTWYRQGITESHEKLSSQVFENPSLYEAALSDGERAIETSGLPEVEKEALRRQWEQTLLTAKANNYLRTNPSQLTGGPATGTGARMIRAMIQVESSGDPNAVSSKGATGLLQVMPDTAREIARELGDTQFPSVGTDKTVQEYLRDPDVSMRYGTYYFNKQMRAFGGDVEAALIAYNGGAQRAERWLNAGRDDSVIPKESADYYKKVMAAFGQQPSKPVRERNIPIVTATQPGRSGGADLSGVKPEVLSRWQEVQNVFGKQVPVVSGYRDSDRNARAGGAKNSRHIHGDALDLDVRGLSKTERIDLIQTASAMGFTGIGVYGNSIHIDTGPRRSWGPSHGRESVPGWAEGAINAHLNGEAQPTPEGGTVYLSPEFEGLPLEKRIELYDKAIAASETMEAEQRAQAKAAYDQHKGSLELGIETGDIGSELTILHDAVLTDAHKADLLASYRTKNEESIQTADALAAFEAGALRVDPYDSKGKKTVDNMFKEIAKTVSPEDIQATTEDIVRQTGVVPQQALNAIRGGLTSQNVQEVAAAAQAAQRLSAVDSAALSRRDGGSEAQTAADDFSYYVNRLNLTPDQAAQRLIDARDPQKQRDRKALEPLAKEFVKERQEEDLGSLFNDSWFGSDPAIGFTPAQEAGIKAEYIAIAEDEFYRSNGDAEIAKNRAMERMKVLYGVTSVTGQKTVMKHPPERYWPAIRYANKGKTLDYARNQLRRELKQIEPNIDIGNVQLVTTPETDAMVKSGEMPAYAVLYKDANGVYQSIPGKLWRPDVEAEERSIQLQRSIEERLEIQRLDDARRQQEEQRKLRNLEEQRRQQSLRLGGQRPPAQEEVDITPDSGQDQIDQQRQRLLGQQPDSMTFGVP